MKIGHTRGPAPVRGLCSEERHWSSGGGQQSLPVCAGVGVLEGAAGVDQAAAEEERLLQRALEESKNDAQDPDNPDVDRMTYEQLMELGENAGQVSRGYTTQEINRIPAKRWYQGLTQSEWLSN